MTMSAILTKGARQLCWCGVSQTHSDLTSTEFNKAIARAFLGENCPHEFTPRGNEMTWIQDSIALALQLQSIFERLNILYYITGGVAAATYGEPRTTRDLDVVIAVSLSTLDQLVQRLESEGFYVPGVEDVRSGRMLSLGITHRETIARADLMLGFEREKFFRRRAISIPERGTLYLASPEDIILSKLSWGALSQSEKQWRDVLGVLKVQRDKLDFDYLREQSQQLGVFDALIQAFTEAGF
jgi:hypothetical protein